MNEQTILVSLDQIDPNPYQPRLSEDPAVIAEIAASIEKNGLMQIPTARQVGDRYQLAFGHTRLAAYKELNRKEFCFDYEKMPLIIRELTDLQMFELGVAENIKRRDLNPIETATAMRVYMDGFGKNSEEAAGFFNVSAETVRGTVRLLNLPEKAQKMVSDGSMTQSTARAMLSMQKVASEKAVLETLKRIEHKDDAPDWDRNTPEEIIEHAVDNLAGVKEMWQENNREGKPRGGTDLWLLDMKNFPNKLLAIPTAEQLALALDIMSNKKALKLVEEYVEYLEADSINPEDETFDQGFHDTNVGQAQKKLDALAKMDITYKERIEHLINPPACTACPFYTKVQGSHYCGIEICWGRKRDAWKFQMIQSASKTLGIAIYDEADGNFSILDSTHDREKKLFDKRGEDLRLIPRGKVNGYPYQWSFDGIKTDYFCAVVVGKTKGTLHTKTNDRFSPAAKLEQKKARLFNVKRKELIWEFTAAGAGMFEGMNKAALDNVDDWKYLGVDDRPPQEVTPSDKASIEIKAEYLRRKMVWNMIDRVRYVNGHTSQTKVVHTAKMLASLAEKWEIKFPKSIQKMAEQADEEIAAIGKEAKKA